MPYFIDGPTERIYFTSQNLCNINLKRDNNFIKRINITFLDDYKFFEFSNSYEWICMKTFFVREIPYLRIHINPDKYEYLQIYRDYINM